ncbi:class I SAM-dependent methyltransferase [Bradyrhizobium sp. CCBAU 53415]|uniref:class I SAM-dependent methyltransferase n=1 Tax=Bradyrhizobium sp. CCBAU 53415 TaxID=1325119 RepID=UPI002304D7D8|nr:class I SAM-dependent methyltransferase [Bradyrhizobium sp. CCBAU 53415]
MTNELDRIRDVYRRRIKLGVINRYSPFVPGELLMLQRREEETLRLLRKYGIASLSHMRILEVGCGRGARLADWSRWGAAPESLYGIDLMEPLIREAELSLPTAHFSVGSADRMPYADQSFDIVVQLTVFTSIMDTQVKLRAAAEMCRVAKPDALIVWYDFRYPNHRNSDVRPIGLKELRELFPGWDVDAHSMTLLPPLARALAPLSWAACRLLEKCCPPLRSHYLAVLRKRRP